MGVFEDAFKNLETGGDPGSVATPGPLSTPARITPEARPLGVFERAFQDIEPDPAVTDALVDLDPDEEARRQRVERRDAGLEGIDYDLDQVERGLKLQDIQRDMSSSPATARFLANPKNMAKAHDATEELGVIEGIANAFVKGRLLVEAGQEGHKASRTGDETAEKRGLARLKQAEGLSVEDTGFLSFLGSAAEILGQQYETLLDPMASVRIGTGMALGASLAGPFGGPLAPVTAVAGGLTGASAGGALHFATEAMETEGGNAYLSMREIGIEAGDAQNLAMVVGVVNMALEVAGASGVIKPLTEGFKKIAKKSLLEQIKQATLKSAAAKAGKVYATSIAAETTTEILQEAVNVAAEEIGKGLSDKDLEAITPEELGERLLEVAVKTAKGMAVLGLGGAGVTYVAERKGAKAAKENHEIMLEVREAAMASKLYQRDPEATGDHIAEVLSDQTVTQVWVPADRLVEWALKSEENMAVYEQLDIESEVSQALDMGGDINLPGDVFSTQLMLAEDAEILQHVRYGVEELTDFEADQVQREDLSSVIDQYGEVEVAAQTEDEAAVALAQAEDVAVDRVSGDTTLEIAEASMGLQGMFRTADEAGLNPRAYESYLAEKQKAAEAGGKRQQAKVLNQEKREATKEYKAQLATEVDAARQDLVQTEPVYQALDALQSVRLSRDKVLAILDGADNPPGFIADLPKQNGRQIVERGSNGVDPEAHAQLYGFLDAKEMLLAFIGNPPVDEVAQSLGQRAMREKFQDMGDRIQALEAALDSLQNDDQAAFLAAEVNILRAERKEGRVSARVLSHAARQRIEQTPVGEIGFEQLFRTSARKGKEAGKLIRAGDRPGALKAKFHQLVNFQMARQADKVRKDVGKKLKSLSKFTKPKGKKRSKSDTLPVEYREVVQTILGNFSLDPRIGDRQQRPDVSAFLERKASEGVDILVDPMLLDPASNKPYEQLSYEQFVALYNSIQAIAEVGRQENKLSREEDNITVGDRVEDVQNAIATNLSKSNADPNGTGVIAGIRKLGRGFVKLHLNANAIVRVVDGSENLGPVYRALKRPYDLAVSSGYLPGSIGFNPRQLQEANRLEELMGVYTAKERAGMNADIKVPGVEKRMTRASVVGVILNSGNLDNKQALIDSEEFTDAELQAIRVYAEKQDWDYAQSVWDYLNEFFPEVEAASIRRFNVRPERVEAVPIETPYGTYAGGYFPLSYDPLKNAEPARGDFEDIATQLISGKFLAGSTKDGHMRDRVGSGGRKLKLNPSVVNAHVNQVVYDLEMGDALRDIRKVLYNPKTRKAFADQGYGYLFEALDLWFGDQITGELHFGGIENMLRWMRTGFTVTKLGWNVGTMLLQPFGLLQSTTVIGFKPVLESLATLTYSGRTMYRQARELSPMMDQRDNQLQAELTLAGQQLTRGLFTDKLVRSLPQDFLGISDLPGKTEKSKRLFAWSMFVGIKKMQRVVDVVTWHAAMRQGMEEFNGDQSRAIEHADNAVIRSQATNIFGDRSAIERGTVSSRVRQTELVRMFTPLMSYFIAKNNIYWGQVKKTNFRNPGEVLGLAWDTAVLYLFEALLVAMLRGELPDEEDLFEKGTARAWAEFTAKEGAKSMMAGMAGIREFGSEMQGFRGGGVVASVAEEWGKMSEQVSQGEFDRALRNSLIKFGGFLLHVPSSQPVKSLRAMDADEDGYDISPWEWVMGPNASKY